MRHMIAVPEGATHAVVDEGVEVDFARIQGSSDYIKLETNWTALDDGTGVPEASASVDPDREAAAADQNEDGTHTPRIDRHSVVVKTLIERELEMNRKRLRQSLIFRGDLVRKWRMVERLSTADLAPLIGYAQSTSVANIESGHARPTKPVVTSLALLMELDPADLFDIG